MLVSQRPPGADLSTPPPATPFGRGRRLRVVFCVDNMSVGGTEMNAVRIAERLDRDAFELSVVCLRDDGPLADRYRESGVAIDVFPIGSLVGRRAVREGLRLHDLLLRRQVDIVHSHDRYTNVFATPWARLAGTRAIIASKRWGQITRVHGTANAAAYRLAHCVLANSEAVADSLVREDGVRRDRIAVIPNFVDEDAFAPPPPGWVPALRGELGIPADALVAGVVANLRAVKDHRTLLQAVAGMRTAHPRLHVVLVGEGDHEPALRSMAAALGVNDIVHFAGRRPNTPNLNHLFDVSVLCSTSEGFPNSIVEAMAAGRAVVATRVGGIPDAVVEGTTGLLVPPREPVMLGAAIGCLLRARGLREEMGMAARLRARAEFSAVTAVARLESLYRQLVGTSVR